MNAYLFADLTLRAQENAMSLYWREALPVIELSAPRVARVTFTGPRVVNLSPIVTFEALARVELIAQMWLFTEHGERIA